MGRADNLRVGGDGVPTGELGDRTSIVNPTTGYFVAGSLYFEPFAIGFGAYDVGSQRERIPGLPAVEGCRIASFAAAMGSVDANVLSC